MDIKKFSWLKFIPQIKASILENADDGLKLLQQMLQIHACQGFEIELIGKLLCSIPVDKVQHFPLCRIAILASYTTEPIASTVRVALLIHGYFSEVYEAPFGAYLQEILESNSGLYIFRPDAIVIAVSARDCVSGAMDPSSDEIIEQFVIQECRHWDNLWKILSLRINKPILQHLYETPEYEFLGIAERKANWTNTRFINIVNERLIKSAPSFVQWIDVDMLAARIGRQNWYDPRLYHYGKFGFSTRYLPEYMQLLMASLRYIFCKVKKALIVDLDNTLWGGVVGDDGIDGIHLGPESSDGEAYLEFCHYVKKLSQRGVILGVCSKNELSTIIDIFNNHPYMPLKLSDFAAIRANWQNKATNLASIAEELNIDISAIVFIDDNPAECDLVRQLLPEVQVIQMDGDPSWFSRKIDYLHLFESSNFSEDDFKRTNSYQAKKKAQALQNDISNVEEYLTSLQMTARIIKAEQEDLPRLAQMEFKTNQFNLSTRRLDIDLLRDILHSPNQTIFAIFLSDRFTNHGLVASISLAIIDNKLVITDWLMSCRVFSRTLEYLIFNFVVQFATEKNILCIQAKFNPTLKNKVMVDLFESLNFVSIGTIPEGPWEYKITLDKTCLKSFIALDSPTSIIEKVSL